MGMPGMTNESVAAYAAIGNANDSSEKKQNEEESTLTVAEFRNLMNPVTKYYDQYNARKFLNDDSISVKEKIEVILGKFVAETVDYNDLNRILKGVK